MQKGISKYSYIIGQRFGYVEPVEYIGRGKFRCICHNCDNKNYVNTSQHLVNSEVVSCGCLPKFKSIIGKQYGDFRVVSYAYTKNYATYWNCICTYCSSHIVASRHGLVSGRKKSCSCRFHSSNFQDITGKQYGTLIAMEHVKDEYWLFFCTACGRGKVMRRQDVISGKCQSCGCLNIAIKGSKGENEVKNYVLSIIRGNK